MMKKYINTIGNTTLDFESFLGEGMQLDPEVDGGI